MGNKFKDNQFSIEGWIRGTATTASKLKVLDSNDDKRYFKRNGTTLYVCVPKSEIEEATNIAEEINNEIKNKETNKYNDTNLFINIVNEHRAIKEEIGEKRKVSKPKNKSNKLKKFKINGKKGLIALMVSGGIAITGYAIAQVNDYKNKINNESKSSLKNAIISGINESEGLALTENEIKLYNNSGPINESIHKEEYVVEIEGIEGKTDFTYREDSGLGENQIISDELNEDLRKAIRTISDKSAIGEQKELIEEIKANPEKFQLDEELVNEKISGRDIENER